MNAIRKTLLSLALAGAAGSVTAETLNLQFDVSATVPSSDFYVVPVGGWDTTVQNLPWNTAARKLDAVDQRVEIKGHNDSVSVHLDYAPSISNGPASIPLDVKLNGTTIPVGAASPLALTDADGRQFAMNIGPASGATYTAGVYNGAVHVVFDSTPPAP